MTNATLNSGPVVGARRPGAVRPARRVVPPQPKRSMAVVPSAGAGAPSAVAVAVAEPAADHLTGASAPAVDDLSGASALDAGRLTGASTLTVDGLSGASVLDAGRLSSALAPAVGASRAWLSRLLIIAGVAMLPWLLYLAATLPVTTPAAHWDAVWVGLDTAEATGLLATGLLLRRGDPRRSLTAAATATLLAVDAWFDCGTAAAGGERVIALAMAAGLELPLAAGLAALAWRAFPRTSGIAR